MQGLYKRIMAPMLLLKPSATILFLIASMIASAAYCQIKLSENQALVIGQKIWQNEGLGKTENLTVWNEGEVFPSLGIGHFIWYPENVPHTFTEQFPQFIRFARQSSAKAPSWLNQLTASPWQSREAFYADFESDRMKTLRLFLVETIPLQVEFIIARMELALPKMLQHLPREKREVISRQFYRIAEQSTGAYALIDYINFKGEGASLQERYRGEGWGLLQVLENMDQNNPDAMQAFVSAADFVLTRRVKNAPRDESRWLVGWRKRLNTYLP
jgi:hypothetical protein